jgi:magnesium chelatase family protein
VIAATPEELLAAPQGESSAAIATRVALARERQLARQGEPNARLPAAHVDLLCAPDEAAQRFVQQAASRLAWSGRRLHRCLKVARTIADLAGAERIGLVHVAEALQLQRVLAGS